MLHEGMPTAPPELESVLRKLVGRTYDEWDCFALAREIYHEGLGIRLATQAALAAESFVEVWFETDKEDPCEISQAWDLWLFAERRGSVAEHVAIAINDHEVIHTTEAHGVTIEPMRRLAPFLVQVARLHQLWDGAIVPIGPGIETGTHPVIGPEGSAQLREMISPVRSHQGDCRYRGRSIKPGSPISHHINGTIPEQIQRNSQMIDPAVWDRALVHAGDDWVIIPKWRSIGIPLILLAASMALQFAMTKIFAPRQRLLDDGGETTYTAAGIQGRSARGRPVPIVYGRHRIGLSTLQFSVHNEVQFIDDGRQEIALVIENITGGHTTGNDEDFTTIRHPVRLTVTGHSFDQNQTVRVSGVQGKDRINKEWVIIVEDANTIRLLNSEGADGRAWTGGGTVSAQGPRITTATDASSRFVLFGAVCEGEISGFVLDETRIEGQPMGNFPGVAIETRNGAASQTAIAQATEVATTHAVQVELDETEFVYSTTDAINAFVLNIEFPFGLVHRGSNGGSHTNMVHFRYRWRPSGTTPWNEGHPVEVRARKSVAVRFSIRKENLSFDSYDIGITRTSVMHADTTFDAFRADLNGVTEIVDNTLTYDDTAVAMIHGSLTENIQNREPSVTMVVDGLLVRINNFIDPPVYSNNPSWCSMNQLTNMRYGFQVPDEGIDLPAFGLYASYCDQLVDGVSFHTLNIVLDRLMSEQRMISELTGPSRAEMLYIHGKYSPRISQDGLPVRVYNWAQVRNFRRRYFSDPDDINVLHVQWPNPALGYRQDPYTHPDEANWPAEVHSESIQVRGLTNVPEVSRYAQFLLRSRQLPKFGVTFDVPIRGMLASIHEIIGLSHPQTAWGVGGLVGDSPLNSTTHIDLGGHEVLIEVGEVYHVWVVHDNGDTEARTVVTGSGTHTELDIDAGTPLSRTPVPDITAWTFGQQSPVDTAVRVLRIIDLTRMDEHFMRIEAVGHIPSIFTDDPATPLPVITDLPDADAPPPPIRNLTATWEARSNSDGTSQMVVVLAWDIAPMAPGLAEYGGFIIFRREVLFSAGLGQAEAGVTEAGALQGDQDLTPGGFERLDGRLGDLRTYEDFTALQFGTYTYRVVPLSKRGIPNNVGMADVTITITGRTTPDFIPFPPPNLRLIVRSRGGRLYTEGLYPAGLYGSGVVIYEGTDIAFAWDAAPNISISGQAIAIAGYRIEIFSSDGALRLVEEIMTGTVFPYPIARNREDAVRFGRPGAIRALTCKVWTLSVDDMESLEPSIVKINNIPVEMQNHIPDITPLIAGGLLNWSQFAAPDDLERYEVFLDTVNPPVTIYDAMPSINKQVSLVGLTPGTTYFSRIAPSDPFGRSPEVNWSQTVTFVPLSSEDGGIDLTPPPIPQAPTLSTGSVLNEDGTVHVFVEAEWPAILQEGVTYQVRWRYAPDTVGFTEPAGALNRWRQEPARSNSTIFVAVNAVSQFGAPSEFSPESSLTTGGDTVAPGPVINLQGRGFFRANVLLWVPPDDRDLLHTEILSSQTNDRNTATEVGRVGLDGSSFLHDGLEPASTHFYWVRVLDRSRNASPWNPVSPTGGLSVTTRQINDEDIADGSITGASLAFTIDAITIVQNRSEITTPTVDQLIYEKDTERLLRWTGTTWEAATLSPGQITETDIAPDSISTPLLQANAVVADKLAANSVIAGKIAAAAVRATEIAAGSIDAQHLVANIIQAIHVGANEIITQSANIRSAIIGDAHINNVSADKINGGLITALVGLGVGSSFFFDGPQRRMDIFDGNSQLRYRAGRLGTGSTDFGYQVFNEFGALMEDSRAGGVTALGIQSNVINANHIRTDVAVITNALQVASAIIDTGHITNVAANKITSGLITAAELTLGTAQVISLSGIQQLIRIRDQNQNIRVDIGRLGLSATDWGILTLDHLGAVQWDSRTGGASTAGIQNEAVTTPKIAEDAVTVRLQASSSVIDSPVPAARTTLLAVAFSDLEECMIEIAARIDIRINTPDAGVWTIEVALWEDSVGGTPLLAQRVLFRAGAGGSDNSDPAHNQKALLIEPLFLPSATSSKVILMTIDAIGGATGSFFSNPKLWAKALQR